MEEHEYLEVQKKYWGCKKKPPTISLITIIIAATNLGVAMGPARPL